MTGSQAPVAAALSSVVTKKLARAVLAAPGAALSGLVARTTAWLDEPGNDMVTLADDAYPARLFDLADPPLKKGGWDASASLNVIDMLPEPEQLPKLQRALVRPGGLAIQSCPYIWHAQVAAHLREMIPSGTRDSADAAEWLYRNEGFTIGHVERHVPWLFFKHARQLEVYSVHFFVATL